MRTITEFLGTNKCYVVKGVFNLILSPNVTIEQPEEMREITKIQRLETSALGSYLHDIFSQICHIVHWKNNVGGEITSVRKVTEDGQTGLQFVVEPCGKLCSGQLRAFEKRLEEIDNKFFGQMPHWLTAATTLKTEFVATKEL